MVIFCAVSGFGGNVDYAFLGLTVHIGLVLVRFVSTNHASSPVSMAKWNNVKIWYTSVIKNESSLFQKRRNTCILAKHIIVLHVLPKKLHPIPPTKKSFQPFKPSAWIYYDKKQHLKILIWGLLSSTVKEDNNEYNDKDHCNNSGEGGSDGRVGGVRLPLPLGQLGGLWPRRTYAKIKQWSLTLHSEFCYTCSDIKSLNFKKKPDW